MVKKIEGFAPNNDLDSLNGVWLFKDRTTEYPATMIVHKGTRERVFTESEIQKAIERRIDALPETLAVADYQRIRDVLKFLDID